VKSHLPIQKCLLAVGWFNNCAKVKQEINDFHRKNNQWEMESIAEFVKLGGETGSF